MAITHSLVICVEDQEWKMSKEGDEASDSSLFSENQAGDAVCLPRAREFMSEHVTQLKKKWIPEPGTFEFSSSFVLGGGGGWGGGRGGGEVGEGRGGDTWFTFVGAQGEVIAWKSRLPIIPALSFIVKSMLWVVLKTKHQAEIGYGRQN